MIYSYQYIEIEFGIGLTSKAFSCMVLFVSKEFISNTDCEMKSEKFSVSPFQIFESLLLHDIKSHEKPFYDVQKVQ